MKKSAPVFVVFFLTLALATPVPSEELARGLKPAITEDRASIVNPHIALGCASCHGVSDVRVSEGGAVPLVKGDIQATCYSCHDKSSNLHPVGQAPSMNVPGFLPLKDGKITCVTCHDPHLDKSKDYLLRGFQDGRYMLRMDLCADCHGLGFQKKNPHANQKERGKCTFCHQSEPARGDTSRTVRFRYGILRTCMLCHNVSLKEHPRDFTDGPELPASLPRDVDGKVTCATCHDPHGTTDTLAFLRRAYVLKSEMMKSSNPHSGDCRACHRKTPGKGWARDDIYAGLRYGGDINLLCNSCHGAHNMHPTYIAPGTGRIKKPADLPLDPKGRINCMTCHEMNCASGQVTLRLSGGDAGSTRRLCYSCHDEAGLARTNPHRMSKASGMGCLLCHEHQPNPSSNGKKNLSFISDLRMICLSCHEKCLHPSGTSHLVMPVNIDVPKDMPLDETGRITCITCHNPHTGGESGNESGKYIRLRKPYDTLCASCHKKI